MLSWLQKPCNLILNLEITALQLHSVSERCCEYSQFPEFKYILGPDIEVWGGRQMELNATSELCDLLPASPPEPPGFD